MTTKYIVHPWPSVPFTSVVRFHGVNPNECVNADWDHHMRGLDQTKLVHLYPDGDHRASVKIKFMGFLQRKNKWNRRMRRYRMSIRRGYACGKLGHPKDRGFVKFTMDVKQAQKSYRRKRIVK